MSAAGPVDDFAFGLLSRSPVTVYWRQSLFEDAIGRLQGDGYQTITFQSSGWDGAEAMHDAFAAALSFPDYYGRNLDALSDCMWDVVNQDYGWVPPSAGLVIAFLGFDAFARTDSRTANIVLDIIAGSSRAALLAGRRLLSLVQSDDPDLVLDPVGASAPRWNDEEWLDANRH